ncbi:hypothetical protein GCM10020254_46580 [Streptomyces goshikiensis]
MQGGQAFARGDRPVDRGDGEGGQAAHPAVAAVGGDDLDGRVQVPRDLLGRPGGRGDAPLPQHPYDLGVGVGRHQGAVELVAQLGAHHHPRDGGDGGHRDRHRDRDQQREAGPQGQGAEPGDGAHSGPLSPARST